MRFACWGTQWDNPTMIGEQEQKQLGLDSHMHRRRGDPLEESRDGELRNGCVAWRLVQAAAKRALEFFHAMVCGESVSVRQKRRDYHINGKTLPNRSPPNETLFSGGITSAHRRCRERMLFRHGGTRGSGKTDVVQREVPWMFLPGRCTRWGEGRCVGACMRFRNSRHALRATSWVG